MDDTSSNQQPTEQKVQTQPSQFSKLSLVLILTLLIFGFFTGSLLKRHNTPIQQKNNIKISPTAIVYPTLPPNTTYDPIFGYHAKRPTAVPKTFGKSLWENKYKELCQNNNNSTSLIKLNMEVLGLIITNPSLIQKSAECSFLQDSFSFTLVNSENTATFFSPEYYQKWYVDYIEELQKEDTTRIPYVAGRIDKILKQDNDIEIVLTLNTGCDPTPGCTIEHTGVDIIGKKTLTLSNGDEIRITSTTEIVERGSINPILIQLLKDHATFDTKDAGYPIVKTFDVNLLYNDFGQDIDKYYQAMYQVLSAISIDDVFLTKNNL